MLTVTYTKSLHRSPDCKLRIEGINEIKAFNMKIPTVDLKPHPMDFPTTGIYCMGISISFNL